MAEFKLMSLDDLQNMLLELGQAAGKVENNALKAAAQPIAKEMIILVPVSTIDHKHIREDIQVSGVKTKDGVKYIEIGPGKDTNWRAKFLEWGTSKMQAIPFVQPAYEHKIGDALAEMKRILREALR